VKFKAIALALFVAGACTSFAIADDGHGKGKKPAPAAATTTGSTTTGSTTTSETSGTAKGKAKQAEKKVTLCHKAGKSGRWVKISVSKSAAKSKLKHGDVAPDASGKCPTSAPATTTTSTTTTSVTTTTSATTTTTG
jgi:hypothetical protein